VLFLELDEPAVFFEAEPPDADDPEDRDRLVDERLDEALLRDDPPDDVLLRVDPPADVLLRVDPPADVLFRDEPPDVVLFRAASPDEVLLRDEDDFALGPLEDDLDLEPAELEELDCDVVDLVPDFDAADFDFDPDEDVDFFEPEPELLDFLLEAFLVCAILFPPFYTRTDRARTLRCANTIPLVERAFW
jgi:hypothetical protein